MLRVAAGDLAAFDTLVERVLPRLLGFFRRLGADRAGAEDLAQEVLFKIYRVRERYEARAQFITYLFHVARNHWIDHYRHRRIQPGSVSADAPGSGEAGTGLSADLPARPEAPEGRAEQHELARALEGAIQDLGQEHRDVFVLSQVEGLRYQDIAAILSIPVGTVKSRMHAAFRLLRDALSRAGFEP